MSYINIPLPPVQALLQANRTLTSPEIKSLQTSIAIAPPPGLGIVLIPAMLVVSLTPGSELLTANIGADLKVRWFPDTRVIPGITIIGTQFISAPFTAFAFDEVSQTHDNSNTIENNSLDLFNNGVQYGGNPSDDALLKVTLFYHSIDL